MSDPEAQFRAWVEAESRASERRRLKELLRQYELAEFASYLLALAWVTGIFVAYQLGWVTAALAGLITLWSFLGGGFVVWQIKIRRRGVQARLAQLGRD